MRKIATAIAIAALAGLWSATPASATELMYGFCKVTDHGTLSVYTAIFSGPGEDGDIKRNEKAALAAIGGGHPFDGEPHAYCYQFDSTKAEAEATMAERVAKDSDLKVVHDPRDPSKFPNNSGPSVWDAKTFLKETLTNGVSRVHRMKSTDSMYGDGAIVKEVSGGRCDSRIVYVGDWFGRPADYVLYVDWTRTVDVGPFYADASRSHIKILAATRHEIVTTESIPGFVIDPGSESMEARLLKALKVIVDACAPKSSTGF